MKQQVPTIDDCKIWGRFSERFESFGTGSEFVDRGHWIGVDGHIWSMIKIEVEDAKNFVRRYRTHAQYQEFTDIIVSVEKIFLEFKGYKVKQRFFASPIWICQVLIQFDTSYVLLGYFARSNLVAIFDYLEVVFTLEASLTNTAVAAIAAESL
jgi:hypothetical protein